MRALFATCRRDILGYKAVIYAILRLENAMLSLNISQNVNSIAYMQYTHPWLL